MSFMLFGVLNIQAFGLRKTVNMKIIRSTTKPMKEKVAVAFFALGALVAGSVSVFAGSHGNALVHSREFRGQVYMMNQSHMSLYFYASDTAGVSNCYAKCSVSWPPALLDANAELGENYTLIERTDGTMQIAYKSRPLYRFAGDEIGRAHV